MRRIAGGGLLAAALMLTGCDVLPGGIGDSSLLACNGTERALCGAVAELAIAQMNVTATGPITRVELTRIDCGKAARSFFRSELATATDCWSVEVTGERSHGGGMVARFADQTLRPYWS